MSSAGSRDAAKYVLKEGPEPSTIWSQINLVHCVSHMIAALPCHQHSLHVENSDKNHQPFALCSINAELGHASMFTMLTAY